ncbi:phosphate acyltransferase PlsX [Marinobacteraceae bacterium S3BR75-40.1]
MTENHEIVLAVDAMGGDRGPEVAARAAARAVAEDEALSILLVGQQDVLKAFSFVEHPRIRLVHADNVVAMDERPSHALRHKMDSSMAVALRQVSEGQAQACVSAGNTGALMSLGRYLLKMYPGMERPAIIKRIPSLHGRCFVLDLGANVDASAENLYQFAIMGSLMAQVIDRKSRPRVALLNVGSEEIKGSEQVRLAAHMMAECERLHYIGYVEGDDLFQDVADVVVCDGFVGNIALKTGEGVAGMLMEVIEKAFTHNIFTRILGALARPYLRRVLKQIDPARHNGASLLGLQGVVVKSHGNAGEQAFLAALRQAAKEAKMELPARVGERLDEMPV